MTLNKGKVAHEKLSFLPYTTVIKSDRRCVILCSWPPPPKVSGVTYLRFGFHINAPLGLKKNKKLLTSAPSINAIARSARHDLRFQKVIAPQDSPFFFFPSHFPLHHRVCVSLPSLLNCLANISARERQISPFPVDIVPSELAVTPLII